MSGVREAVRGVPPFRGRGLLASAQAVADEVEGWANVPDLDVWESGGDDDEDERLASLPRIGGLFPVYARRWLLRATLELCYTQHGGSGFSGFSPERVAAMDLDEIEFALKWLHDRRGREAAAIRSANSKTR